MKTTPYKFNGKPNTTACVGINGGTNDVGIRSGFHEAISGIINQINDTQCVDTLVYPLIFYSRHSVELGLKIILKSILYICSCKGAKTEEIAAILKSAHTHDIMTINNEIKKCITIDDRLLTYLPIEEYLDDYAIDPEGDAFRYALSSNNIPHMESKNITHISLDIFVENYFKVSEMIEKYILELDYYRSEYNLGIFTKSLSRKQIEEISLMIGNIMEWEISKEEIIKKYNITSSELTKAVNIIKKNRNFSINVGLELKFPNISDEALMAYKEYVTKIKKIEHTEKLTTPFGFENEIVKYEIEEYDVIQDDFLSKITYEELAFLSSCIEIDKRIDLFPEELDNIYNEMIEAYHLDSKSIIYKLGNGRLHDNLLGGLTKCGQKTYYNIISS